MLNQFSRTQLLYGKEAMAKLQNSHVAIFGLGGVGGYVGEALVRSGIGSFDLIDDDKICLTNLNRQIIATFDTVGKYKTDVMKERMLQINPKVNVQTHQCFFLPENANDFSFEDYDYIIDACDDIKIKIELIKYAKEHNIKIISSLGTARKLDPQKLKIITLNKTFNDPLAKKLRYELKRENIPLNIPVVWSEEDAVPVKEVLGSAIFVPASAGLLLVNYIFLDILKERASI